MARDTENYTPYKMTTLSSLFLSAAISAANAGAPQSHQHEAGHTKGLHQWLRAHGDDAEAATAEGELLWFSQKLDHFNKAEKGDHRVWNQQ